MAYRIDLESSGLGYSNSFLTLALSLSSLTARNAQRCMKVISCLFENLLSRAPKFSFSEHQLLQDLENKESFWREFFDRNQDSFKEPNSEKESKSQKETPLRAYVFEPSSPPEKCRKIGETTELFTPDSSSTFHLSSSGVSSLTSLWSVEETLSLQVSESPLSEISSLGESSRRSAISEISPISIMTFLSEISPISGNSVPSLQTLESSRSEISSLSESPRAESFSLNESSALNSMSEDFLLVSDLTSSSLPRSPSSIPTPISPLSSGFSVITPPSNSSSLSQTSLGEGAPRHLNFSGNSSFNSEDSLGLSTTSSRSLPPSSDIDEGDGSLFDLSIGSDENASTPESSPGKMPVSSPSIGRGVRRVLQPLNS